MFGWSSSFPPLVGGGGGLVCESVGKANLLSDNFDCTQSSECVDVTFACHQPPSLITFAFGSSEVRRLMLDLNPCGGTDRLGMFPLFLRRTANVIHSRLSVVFLRLFRLGSSLLVGERQMSPHFERSTVLFCAQLSTDFNNFASV